MTQPELRRVLPGLAVSSLGDGMALVAVSWLALRLAPASGRGTWVAVAVAAYTLPSVVGTVVFGRVLRNVGGARLVRWNALLRASALAAIPAAAALGVLSVRLYVALLAVSALLHVWGQAGRYALITELLPARSHVTGNAVLTTLTEFATIVGPAIAGVLIAELGAVWVLAIDAVTFAILAAVCRPSPAPHPADGVRVRPAGFAALRRDRALLGLVLLGFGFFALFGPVYVALPLHVSGNLHASAATLGLYYTAFGGGAVLGGLAAGYLRSRLWPVSAAIVAAFGVTLLPLGLGAAIGWSLATFALSGLVWAPYLATTMAIFQKEAAAADLPALLAANGTVTVVALPLGTLLGGPLVAALGPQHAIAVCAAAMIVVGMAALPLAYRRDLRAGGTARP